ncbi:MAG: glycosyltransferase family 2 protein [Acidobacteria bacterium]|nr:glycosyltransferase family 2 protein [Acidobacteriota bacterium]
MVDLSIVIPTYQTAGMTLGTCRAVLASMPDSAEVIVADDGSTDATAETITRELPSVRVVRLPTNRGFAPAANAGIRATTGRIVLLLNSDAVPKGGALRAIVDAFDADPKLGVAGATLLNQDGSPQWSGGPTPTLAWMIGVVSGAGRFTRLLRTGSSASRSRPVDWVSGAAMAIRRETWDAAGPLDENFRFYCQDIEICERARAAGWNVRLVSHAEVIHGMGVTLVGEGELRHDPVRLWPDLLDWGTRRYGASWGAIARPVLVAAAWARIGARALKGRDPEAGNLVRAARALATSSPSDEARKR